MSLDEQSQFRITVWPDRVEPPLFAAAPRLVGVVGSAEVAAQLTEGLQLLPGLPQYDVFPPVVAEDMPAPVMLTSELAALVAEPRGEDLLSWLDIAERSADRFTRWGRPEPRIDYLLFDHTQTVSVALPDEMFLRDLLAVDATNPLEVGLATMTWGPLSLPEDPKPAWGDSASAVATHPPASASYLQRDVTYNTRTGESWVEHQDHFPTHWDLIVARHLYYDTYSDLWIPDDDEPADDEHQPGRAIAVIDVREYSWYFRVFQALMESWGRRQADPATAVSDWYVTPWVSRQLPAPASELDALDTLARSLNSYLSGLGPHVALSGPKEWWRPVPRLSAALALQALAFISSGLPARRCANETCRSLFARQQGRSQYGQRRSVGVIYCSSACAKAQTQREYRRRNRARG